MAHGKLAAWDDCGTSHVKIVLLGGRNSGKSCLGNLILGKEEFVPTERTSCCRRLGVVGGRWLTVVDTPGWWCDLSARDTSRLVRRELLGGVALCSPGPHVFLITVKAGSGFSERRRQAMEEHVSLLGDDVWRHCIVVFTCTGRSERTEEVAKRGGGGGGGGLCWLSEKCGHRCHRVVLNAGSEVTELMAKVQKLITENENKVFEMQESIFQTAVEERRRVEERAQMRFIRMRRHRSLMRKRLRPVTEIRLVLLGAKSSGKSSVLNTILDRDSVQQLRRTAQCRVEGSVVFGRQLTVVDTPGWWMNYFCHETSLFDRREMALSVSLCPPGPHVFLLVIRVDRAFAETHRRAAQEHLELLSEHIWSRVILLFSFGDWLGGTTTEQYLETEGEALLWLVEKCCNRYHVLNNKTRGDGFQVRELIKKIEEVMSGTGCWHYEIGRKELEVLEKTMKTEADRARERLMKKDRQQQAARSQLEELGPLQELTVILAGSRKAGKSCSGNTILSTDSFHTDTHSSSCSRRTCRLSERTVSVVDTPGRFSVTPDLLTKPCALLLVVNPTSSFTRLHEKRVEEQLEGGGARLWSRAVVLFTHGDLLGDASIERRVESEGEPLRRLVERCGNRYHVLDNKNRGDGAQVRELLQLLEETLVGERLAALQRGDQMWKQPHPAEKQSAATPHEKKTSSTAESAASSPSRSSGESSGAAQVVVFPGGRRQTGFLFVDRDRLTSFIASVLKQGLRDPPGGFLDPHSLLRPGDSCTLPPRRHSMLLVSCQSQPGVSSSSEEEEGVRALCHPALRGTTLQRMSESGDLQALLDQWGDSSLSELEAFIDSYFDMVWEQTTWSFQPPETDPPASEWDPQVRDPEREEVLSSIDRKLSKLQLLEEIRGELAELRQNLESSWRAIKDLRDQKENI